MVLPATEREALTLLARGRFAPPTPHDCEAYATPDTGTMIATSLVGLTILIEGPRALFVDDVTGDRVAFCLAR